MTDRMAKAVRSLAGAVAGALLLAGCGGSDAGVDPLRAELIATVPIAGTMSEETVEQSGGRSLGKPVRATLTRRLLLQYDADQQQVLHDALDKARSDGWTDQSGEPPAGGAWVLRKEPRTGPLELTLAVNDHDDRRLIITLVRLDQ